MCTKLTLGGFFFSKRKTVKKKNKSRTVNTENTEWEKIQEVFHKVSFESLEKNLTNYIEDDINRSSWKAQGDWKKNKG